MHPPSANANDNLAHTTHTTLPSVLLPVVPLASPPPMRCSVIGATIICRAPPLHHTMLKKPRTRASKQTTINPHLSPPPPPMPTASGTPPAAPAAENVPPPADGEHPGADPPPGGDDGPASAADPVAVTPTGKRNSEGKVVDKGGKSKSDIAARLGKVAEKHGTARKKAGDDEDAMDESADDDDGNAGNWLKKAKGNSKRGGAKKVQQQKRKSKRVAFAHASFKVSPGENPTSEIPKKLRVMVETLVEGIPDFELLPKRKELEKIKPVIQSAAALPSKWAGTAAYIHFTTPMSDFTRSGGKKDKEFKSVMRMGHNEDSLEAFGALLDEMAMSLLDAQVFIDLKCHQSLRSEQGVAVMFNPPSMSVPYIKTTLMTVLSQHLPALSKKVEAGGGKKGIPRDLVINVELGWAPHNYKKEEGPKRYNTDSKKVFLVEYSHEMAAYWAEACKCQDVRASLRQSLARHTRLVHIPDSKASASAMLKYKDQATRHIYGVDSLSTVVLDGIVNLEAKVDMMPSAGGPAEPMSMRDLLLGHQIPGEKWKTFAAIAPNVDGSHEGFFPTGVRHEEVAKSWGVHSASKAMYELLIERQFNQASVAAFLQRVFSVTDVEIAIRASSYNEENQSVSLLIDMADEEDNELEEMFESYGLDLSALHMREAEIQRGNLGAGLVFDHDEASQGTVNTEAYKENTYGGGIQGMENAVRFAENERSARAPQAATSEEDGASSAPRPHEGEAMDTSTERESAEGENGNSTAASGTIPVVAAHQT